jgi:Protein of unknown function (DUF3237)
MGHGAGYRVKGKKAMKTSRRDILALSSGAALLAMDEASAKGGASAAPLLSPVFSAKVTLSPPIELGTVDGKRKRFIPIAGGTVAGPRLNGVVLPGGGDWQAIHDDGLTEIFARYSLKANDGTVIAVTNPGVRVAAPDIIQRLAAGEEVDPSLYYFRTSPTFDVGKGQHDWLRRKIFIARGIRRPDHVLIDFFQVD